MLEIQYYQPFFFQMMDIAEAEVLTFHQSYERRVFFGAFVRHLFFFKPAVLRVEEPVA